MSPAPASAPLRAHADRQPHDHGNGHIAARPCSTAAQSAGAGRGLTGHAASRGRLDVGLRLRRAQLLLDLLERPLALPHHLVQRVVVAELPRRRALAVALVHLRRVRQDALEHGPGVVVRVADLREAIRLRLHRRARVVCGVWCASSRQLLMARALQ